MAQSGFTPLLIYSSSTASTAPSAGNLTNSSLGSELAINITDGKLYYKDNAGAVQVIASKASAVYNPASVAITGGTIAGVTINTSSIGATTASTGAFTTLSASSTVSGAGFSTYLASPPAIGGTAPSTGAFTTLSLTTPLSLTNGGSGASLTASSGGVIYSGASAMAVTAVGSTGQVLTSQGGSAPIWATPSSGTVSSVSFTGGLISVATATTTPALTVAGTSGGVVYFSSASTWTSSAVLASQALMVGGGAGSAPSTVTTGTGVVTALGVNTGSAGAFVVNGGALGTPSSGTVTNLTGTASININGTVGATTANTGAFTTVSASGVVTSTVATGTAPFTVASTTQVANLNVATAGTAGQVTNALTINNGGAGGASGTTYNGSSAVTISYNSVGASPLAGSSSLTTVGTVTSGTWNGSLITGTYGGTGVNNGASTITIAGNLTHAGAFTQSFTATANTAVTLPAGATASTNNLLSSVTAVGIVTGTPSSSNYLRGDGTWSSTGIGTTTNALTMNNGGAGSASGTTFNGSAAITLSYNSIGASPLAGSSSITTVGTIASGTWNGSLITGTYGGTGVNNGTNTITIGGNVNYSGAFTQTWTRTANTSLTLPISGTVLSSVTAPTNNPITGTPSSSNYLRGDGTWATLSVSPGGSTTQIQYNNAGAFAGSANLVFDGTNVGLGALSAWSGVKALQIYTKGALYSTGANIILGNNFYYNGTNNLYISTSTATSYTQNSGQHIFSTATGGASGTTATFLARFTINNAGAIGVGCAASYGASGTVLTSQGSTCPPVWTTPSVSAATPTTLGTVYGQNLGCNQTSFGLGAGVCAGANSTAVGACAGATSQGIGAVAVGRKAGNSVQGNYAVAVGFQAGQGPFSHQGACAIAIGKNSGNYGQNTGAVSIGSSAGNSSQGFCSIAIGINAGNSSQGNQSIAIGQCAGKTSQASVCGYGIAIGATAGLCGQKQNAIAIGQNAGQTNQGARAIAIGQSAGACSQVACSIAIGFATAAPAAGLFVAPVRCNGTAGRAGYSMLYCSTNKEIVYSQLPYFQNMPAPTSLSTATSLSGAQVLAGYIQYTGSANNLTLPTGTALNTAQGTVTANSTFRLSIINTGSGTATVAVNTGITSIGALGVTAGTSGLFQVRYTAANTYVIYRIA